MPPSHQHSGLLPPISHVHPQVLSKVFKQSKNLLENISSIIFLLHLFPRSLHRLPSTTTCLLRLSDMATDLLITWMITWYTTWMTWMITWSNTWSPESDTNPALSPYLGRDVEPEHPRDKTIRHSYHYTWWSVISVIRYFGIANAQSNESEIRRRRRSQNGNDSNPLCSWNLNMNDK